jgi:hypothetical protein
MLIFRKGKVFHISKIDKPNKLWYPINLLIAQYGEDYAQEKLGVTDPDLVKQLQDAFLDDLTRSNDRSQYLESHAVKFDGNEISFYLDNITKSTATLYIEILIPPEAYRGTGRCPRGYVWANISIWDTPETLAEKLYVDNIRFIKALHKKLKKIMDS